MTRIAIVEDNKVIRESLMEFVKTDPECECVYDCATAKEALKEIPKLEVDIVLMDIQLPDISGIEGTARRCLRLPVEAMHTRGTHFCHPRSSEGWRSNVAGNRP